MREVLVCKLHNNTKKSVITGERLQSLEILLKGVAV